MKKTIYTIYDKNDEIIVQGTTEECCKKLGIKRKHFQGMVSKAINGTYKKYSVVKEKIDEDEFAY